MRRKELLDRKYSKQLVDVVLAMVAHDVEQKQGLGLETKGETKYTVAARPQLDLILRVLNPTPGACCGLMSHCAFERLCVAR